MYFPQDIVILHSVLLVLSPSRHCVITIFLKKVLIFQRKFYKNSTLLVVSYNVQYIDKFSCAVETCSK